MSDKTLVERLREEAKTAREERGLPVYTPEKIEKLADAIEREYLPRPRFEDGKLVNIGDQFEFDGESFHIRDLHVGLDKKTYIVARERDGLFDMEPGERVKRPATEVLDTDGVPIHKGDTVWFVQPESANYGNEYVVSHIGEDSLGKTVWFRGQCGAQAFGRPQYVTHKQPDSLERIEEDARKPSRDYWGCACVSCHDCPAMVDGKRPCERYEDGVSCSRAQMLDLLNRQREVLERDHER